MKLLLVTSTIAALLSGCADMSLPVKVTVIGGPRSSAAPTPSTAPSTSSTSNAQPVATVAPIPSVVTPPPAPGVSNLNLKAILACKVKPFFDPDAYREKLRKSPAVARSVTDKYGQAIFIMQPGFAINGLPVSYITVYGVSESDTDKYLLAYTDQPVSAARKAIGIGNQKERGGLYTYVRNEKIDFAGGKRMTALGCMWSGGDGG